MRRCSAIALLALLSACGHTTVRGVELKPSEGPRAWFIVTDRNEDSHIVYCDAEFLKTGGKLCVEYPATAERKPWYAPATGL